MSTAKPLDELRRRLGNGPPPGAFAALAEEHRRAGRFDEAVTVCREGLARYPTYVSARVTLGRALLDMGDVPAAIEELEQAVSQAPDNLAASKALESARGAVETADEVGEAAMPASLSDADPTPPPAASLDWLTADPASDVPWQLGGDETPLAEPDPASFDSAEQASGEPVEPTPAPGPGALAEPTAWDETIYAPVMPVMPVEEASAATGAAADVPALPADEDVIPASTWLGDEVMAFPAFQAGGPAEAADEAWPDFPPATDAVASSWSDTSAEFVVTPDEVGAGTDADAAELNDGRSVHAHGTAVDQEAESGALDPIATWDGLADAEAHSDMVSWGASVDAVMDEVFTQAAPDAVGVASAWTAASPAGPAAIPPVDPPPALRTLETLLLAIRARRAALAQGRLA